MSASQPQCSKWRCGANLDASIIWLAVHTTPPPPPSSSSYHEHLRDVITSRTILGHSSPLQPAMDCPGTTRLLYSTVHNCISHKQCYICMYSVQQDSLLNSPSSPTGRSILQFQLIACSHYNSSVHTGQGLPQIICFH